MLIALPAFVVQARRSGLGRGGRLRALLATIDHTVSRRLLRTVTALARFVADDNRAAKQSNDDADAGDDAASLRLSLACARDNNAVLTRKCQRLSVSVSALAAELGERDDSEMCLCG